MMMPAGPSANFIVGQASFAFGTLDTFFNAMLRLSDSCEFREFCFPRWHSTSSNLS